MTGSRRPDANWHLTHLYNPRIVEKKSVMPPYRFLFEKRKIERAPSSEALKLSGEYAPEQEYEIVPTDRAKQLVAYVLSLRADTVIFETPITLATAPAVSTNAPTVSTNAPTAPTNAPAAATNAPAK